ncbi:MAG: hypothetical protein M1497_04490 [Nitrospirae bacterium]|nr:hypothetical protein [Nitrospirota bacterium]
MKVKEISLLFIISTVFLLQSCNTSRDQQMHAPLRLDPSVAAGSTSGIEIPRGRIAKNASLRKMGFVFERDKDIAGRPNYIGYCKKVPATFQLIGRADNLDSVTVLAVLDADSERNCLLLAPMISAAVAIDKNSGGWVARELNNILMERKLFRKSYVEQRDFGKRRFEITVTDNIVMLTVNSARNAATQTGMNRGGKKAGATG